MASPRSVKAGAAFVELNVRNQMSRGLRAAERRLRNFGNMVTGIGQRIAGLGAGIAGTGVAAGAAFSPAIMAAGDFQETLSRFEAVFGNQSDAAKDFAETFVTQFGRSRNEILGTLSTFQQFFQGAGKSEEAAAALSQELTTLTTDFASFNNMADADAQQSILSALSGSTETLRPYGVFISESGINEELDNMGVDPAAATELDKVLARLAIIKQAMADNNVDGDLARTAGSFNNQVKSLKGSFDNLLVAVGTPLLEPLAELAGRLAGVIQKVVDWAEENPELIQQIAMWVAGITAAGAALVAIGGVLAVVGIAIGGFVSAIGLIVGAVTGIIGLIGGALVLIPVILPLILPIAAALLAVGAATAVVITYWDEIKQIGANVIDTLKNMWDAFDNLTGISKIFSDALDSLMGVINRVFGHIKTFVGDVVDIFRDNIGTIVNFIKNGEFEKAWDTVAAMGKLIWVKFVIAAKSIWHEFTTYLADIWDTVVMRLAQAWVQVEIWFLKIVQNIANIWQDFIAEVQAGAAFLTAFIASGGDLKASREQAAIERERAERERRAILEDSIAEREQEILDLEQELARRKLENAEGLDLSGEEERVRLLEAQLENLKEQSEELERQRQTREDEGGDEGGAEGGDDGLFGDGRDFGVDPSEYEDGIIGDGTNRQDDIDQINRGIFSARAIGSLQSSGVSTDEEIAQNTRDVAENTRRTADDMRRISQGLNAREAGKIMLG